MPAWAAILDSSICYADWAESAIYVSYIYGGHTTYGLEMRTWNNKGFSGSSTSVFVSSVVESNLRCCFHESNWFIALLRHSRFANASMHQPMRAPATCTRCIAQRTKIYRDVAVKQWFWTFGYVAVDFARKRTRDRCIHRGMENLPWRSDALTSTVTSTIHWTIYIRIACNKAENFSRNILLLTSATVK